MIKLYLTRDHGKLRLSRYKIITKYLKIAWTGLKHKKKLTKSIFTLDFIFCEKAYNACYRGGDLSKKGSLRFELVLRSKRIN